MEEAIDMVEEERADSLYILTTPDTDSSGEVALTVGEAVDIIDDSGIDSNYSATYFPWLQMQDTENNQYVWLPPTLEVVRNIALTDNVAFPWFAAAGLNRGTTNAIKARTKLTLDQRDVLYEGRINPMATFSDVGVVIWGNKTLQSKDTALNRINVRRLLLQARKLISAVSIRLLFEQNDDVVRNQFLSLVNPILDNIRKERGLTDFRVQLDNDPEAIDRNELCGRIFIKPTRSLEFICVEFNITNTGANFDNL
jgi:phage tail sheath protein FI